MATTGHATGSLDRAVALYGAMQRYFYVPERKLYRETYPHREGNPYSYLWPFTEALAAMTDVVGLGAVDASGVRALLEGLRAYWHARRKRPPGYDSYVRPPLGPGGDKYLDDNNWVARTLLQWYRMSGHAELAHLERSRRLFDLIVSNWDDDPAHVPPGGIFWVEAAWNRHRGCGATIGTARLGLRLFALTGEPNYRDWAVRLYEWTRRHLHDPETGLYWDKLLDLEGAVDQTCWAYNQGLMVVAGVLMHDLTGDREHLDHARRVAAAMLGYYRERGFYAQPTIFNALFFRNALSLYAVDRDPALLDALRACAEQAWDDRTNHDAGTHLYKDPYNSERSPDYQLLDQAGLVQILACLAWAEAGKDLSLLG